MRRQTPRIAPRLVTAQEAAAYLGYETTGVLANIPVKPIRLAEEGPGSQPKYDLRALDALIDQLSGLTVTPPEHPAANDHQDDAEAAYENWKASRGPR